MKDTDEAYRGFEQGPIRPPSEAGSLLLRVTRNCPWNRCSFCPVYKGAKFSVRPVSHIKRDIDCVQKYVEILQQTAEAPKRGVQAIRREAIPEAAKDEKIALRAAAHWLYNGSRRSVFLQDADALVMKPAGLAEVLTHLRTRFPWLERVTCYSRSRTIAARKDADLKALANAGLNRIHVGLESGSNEVLKRVAKGVTRDIHITAGLKVKAAGMELSEYVMPGLGGQALSQTHALETADALNRINPDFIRLRTLAIPADVPLADEFNAGRFDRCTDSIVAQELLTFIEHLAGITSVIKSDHILNLFGDLEGTLPEDRARMCEMVRAFLAMPAEHQRVYQVGRRLGLFHCVGDMQDSRALTEAERMCRDLGITADNVDQITNELMARYL
ncbi:MAG: radical SAM protein [Planctomycetes bacterium]|nr:radical SAM protein [Planctomycetota bacterium]